MIFQVFQNENCVLNQISQKLVAKISMASWVLIAWRLFGATTPAIIMVLSAKATEDWSNVKHQNIILIL